MFFAYEDFHELGFPVLEVDVPIFLVERGDLPVYFRDSVGLRAKLLSSAKQQSLHSQSLLNICHTLKITV